jgi:diguanylate cyclase (GGDEF)-like protein
MPLRKMQHTITQRYFLENTVMAHNISLKTKITAYVLLLNLSLVLIMALICYVIFMSWYKNSFENQQMLLVSRIAEELDNKIQFAKESLIESSKLITPEIVANPAAAEHFLNKCAVLNTIYDSGLYLFGPTGKIIAETAHMPSRTGLDLSYRLYIKETLTTRKPYISKPFISSMRRKPVIMFTAPVFAPDGKIIAIFGGSLDLHKDYFLGKLARAKIGKTGYFFLFSRDRTMIMHPDQGLIQKNYSPPGRNHRFDLAVAGMDNSGETLNAMGIRTFQTFKKLNTVHWVLATNYPLKELYEPIEKVTHSALLVIPLGGLLIAFVMWRIMSHLTAPILSLTEQIRHLEKGDTARPVIINSGDEIEELATVFNSLMKLVRKKEKELYHISIHDNLTGLYNRAYFEAELERRSKGRNFPVSLIVVDIDGLKQMNDTLGHAAGDRLIRSTARVLQKAFRSEDVVARTGGDEFAILLGGTTIYTAEEALLRVQKVTEEHNKSPGHLPINLSTGTATAKDRNEINEALILADMRMYEAKAAKKDNRRRHDG